VDTQIILPILAAFSMLNNLNYKHFFGCFIGRLLVMIDIDASFFSAFTR